MDLEISVTPKYSWDKRTYNEALAAKITELAGHLNAANYRFLMLVAEFDERQGWSDGATTSCAHWLNWKCGIDMGAAREKVRTALALRKLPRIAAAMERGELSYSKVRALTRVACEQTEEYLLSIALHGSAHHVETTVRYFRRCLEAQERSREELQQRNRCVHYRWDHDGSLMLTVRLPADAGALVLKALQAAGEQLHSEFDMQQKIEQLRAEGRLAEGKIPDEALEPTHTMRRADGLALLAESFLQHAAEPMSSGDRRQVVIHVDAQTLQGDTAGRCEIDEGPSVAAETSRRLACDASVVTILENDQGEPLNVGRKTRTIPPALRRALNARDRGCRFPGCRHTRFVDAHHIHHWAHGGETKPSNLVSLCHFHHRAVHEGAVEVRILNDGALRFVKPDGRAYESAVPAHGDWKQLPIVHEEEGIHIDAKTAATRWFGGDKMDYGLAIEVLMQQANRKRRVSAETSLN